MWSIEVAIIRPGPIQGGLMHPYLARRAGEEPITYIDERLEAGAASARSACRFSRSRCCRSRWSWRTSPAAKAEELRRALSFHRSHERMDKVVREAAREHDATKASRPRCIEQIVAAMQSFALYGFPESHAISFALLAYASAG